MRAKEFITEQNNLPDRITKPMPATWVIPELKIKTHTCNIDLL